MTDLWATPNITQRMFTLGPNKGWIMKLTHTMTHRSASTRIGKARVSAVVGLAVLGLVLAGCGGGSKSGSTGSDGKATGTVGYMGFEGDDFPAAMKPWIKSAGITEQAQYINSAYDAAAKLKSGGSQQVDVLDIPSSAIELFNATDLLAPIDESKIPNLKKLFPTLQTGLNEFVRNAKGELVGVPYYVSPFGISYNKSKFTTAPSPADLLDPSMKGKYALIDYPDGLLGMACVQLGFKPDQLTKDQMNQVSDLLKKYVANARTVAPSVGQAATLLSSGEVSAIYPDGGFAVGIIPVADRPKFTTNLDLVGGNIVTIELLALSKTATNPAAGLAFINAMIGAKINAEGVSTLGQGAVAAGAAALVSEANKGLYPYDKYDSYLKGLTLQKSPPAKSDKYVTSAQWTDEWTKIKAG
jgi:spermidine/putrescine transport system substrate-binding protein